VPGLFRNLPQPVLAAVVITASLSLADIPGTVRLWKQRRTEFLLSIAAFLGVVLLGVLPGIAIAVGLSILNVFRRAWWPYETVLGRVEGLEGYHDRRSYPASSVLPGLVIYRFDAPLFFANAKTFRDEVMRLAQADPPPAWIVIAAEPVTDVDTTASDVLEDLDVGSPAPSIRATSSPRSRQPSPRSAPKPAPTGLRRAQPRPMMAPMPERDDDARGPGHRGNLEPRGPLDTARVTGRECD
jgi:MFS superfamily sulfate permease-like transporter